MAAATAAERGQRLLRFFERACACCPSPDGPAVFVRRDAICSVLAPWIGATLSARRNLAAAIKNNDAYLSRCERAEVEGITGQHVAHNPIQ